MATTFRGNANVQFDTMWNLYIGSKAFANSMRTRHITAINAYINSDNLTASEQSFLSASSNVAITVLPEHGWDPKCSVSKNITPDNFFTENKGFISSSKTIINDPVMPSNPKNMSQLLTQANTLASSASATKTQYYLGATALSNAARPLSASNPKNIGLRAFSNCQRLASVQLSNDNTWNRVFSEGCFKGCARLTAIHTVTNTNANMEGGVPILPPAGTIACAPVSITVTGTNTEFMTAVFPGYVICSNTAVIGTVAFVESDTSLTLVNPAKVAYSGAWGISNEAMIPAHATTIGKEALRDTNINTISIETHENLAMAASPSKLANIGSYFCTDCNNLTKIYFNVKQNARLLPPPDAEVVPSAATIVTGSHDGWTSTAAQTQLQQLFKTLDSKLSTSTKFKYEVNSTTQLAVITGLAYHSTPLFINNLAIPEYIVHSDGASYEVASISYTESDQTEVVNGSIVSYGAFSQSNPAFTGGGYLMGSLSVSNTLKEISSFSFADQQNLTGDLNITCPGLTYIGVSAFENAYNNDLYSKTLTIHTGSGLVIDKKAFRLTNFDNTVLSQ